MIPIRDRNPTHSWPIVTVLLIVGNIYIFVKHNVNMNTHQMAALFGSYGAIPAQILSPKDIDHLFEGTVSLFTSMFLHGGILHIGGNMLYLWIFGDNVEDRLGHVRFFFFYIFCGLGAAMTHALLMPQSTIPMVGASGAISGVLGAYLIAFPKARVLTIIPIFIFIKLAELPAIVVLGFWFIIQFLNGYSSLQYSGAVGAPGVAWFAHVGGFLLGILGILLLKKR
jgi:membrane associated rhomboid family serine protease